MIQPKVLKMWEYFVYFPFSELHGWIKRSAVQPKTIYSELPLFINRTNVAKEMSSIRH